MQSYCRLAPSLGDLEGDHEYGMKAHQKTWGTFDYEYPRDMNRPTVFFGLYDLRDYYALWRHRGKKWILWAGSDLENLVNGFVFNDGKLKTLSKIFRGFFTSFIISLIQTAENWVEDQDEADKLSDFGVESKICPSFMGDIKDFPVSYKQAFHPNVFIAGHPDREKEYGFEFVEKIAHQVPECIFHLYGAGWKSNLKNVICHGFVPKEQFNREIRNYQCGLRLNSSDGFSEITAKSVLMGQYPITRLVYPMIPNFDNDRHLASLLKSLRSVKKPNLQARNYYLSVLNQYPWCSI